MTKVLLKLVLLAKIWGKISKTVINIFIDNDKENSTYQNLVERLLYESLSNKYLN
jgi:hypothetical protein